MQDQPDLYCELTPQGSPQFSYHKLLKAVFLFIKHFIPTVVFPPYAMFRVVQILPILVVSINVIAMCTVWSLVDLTCQNKFIFCVFNFLYNCWIQLSPCLSHSNFWVAHQSTFSSSTSLFTDRLFKEILCWISLSEVKVKVILWPTVSQPVYPGISGTRD